MFSFAAINDTDSKNQWKPLAPTKEAQEFHLSQLYYDGLLRLQAKDYEKARELLESVLKDPLVSNAEGQNSASDGHLLQLRYLALKNLATVSLQQGPSYYESALHCYLQAVEIDNKDSVVWNQLGTLSCSMGSLSISRWAFEQGLVCSPNNWNCMEKLLEVLICIGDEVACLSIAELILRHWPSHARALHVRNTIEESEPIPFTPRGIDKLEPKHIRLKFPEKRKAVDEDLDKTTASKRLKQSLEIQLTEVSWISLASELLKNLRPMSTTCFGPESQRYRTRDVRIVIQLPPSMKLKDFPQTEGLCIPAGGGTQVGNLNSSNDNEGTTFEEHPQERRSTRLKSRKPGKEESEFSSSKDHAEVVKRFLAPYLVDETNTVNCKANSGLSLNCAEVVANSLNSEFADVINFIKNNFDNCGAYHMGYLLLEKVANSTISYQGNIAMILDLEMVIRGWGKETTPQCSLFLSELYYDVALQSSEKSKVHCFLSEASYHLCKIIESVALEYPFHITGMAGKSVCLMIDVPEDNHQYTMKNPSLLRDNNCFWIRYFWLSARLSLLDGDNEKAQKEFSVVLALFTDKDKTINPLGSIFLSHCKVIKKLTVNRVLHEINLIEIDYLLKNSVSEMLEKNMHAECIKILSPLLLSANDVHLDVLHACNLEGKGLNNSIELSALDILIKSCEQAESMDINVYLNCHRRRLQILLAGAGVEGSFTDNEPVSNALSSCENQSKETLLKHNYNLVAEEVKAISQSASKITSIISPTENFNNIHVAVIGDVQSLLLKHMCHIARKSSGFGVPGSIDTTDQSNFVDAAIAFCKLQHLNFTAPIKSQTELMVAIHDMLAEFGICCARGIGDEEEGTFLKLAIKHLLSLHMNLKSSLNKGKKTEIGKQISIDSQVEMPEQLSHSIHLTGSPTESSANMFNTNMGKTEDEIYTFEKNGVEGSCSESVPSHLDTEKVGTRYSTKPGIPSNKQMDKNMIYECSDDLTEDEREELELNIDSALDQCFYCLYGLNLRSDSSSEEDLVIHKNTCQGDYQTKEQCADVFQYILPYAKASSRTGLIKLRKVLRAIRKHFLQPSDNVLAGNAIDKYLDNPELCEEKLSEEVGSNDSLNMIMRIMFPGNESLKQQSEEIRATDKWAGFILTPCSSDPYLEVYRNLYYFQAQSEEISATDKWAGFILTKEGEEFVQRNADLFKYDLLYNPTRLESWQKLANIFDEEVDLLLNDGSKQINVVGWRKNVNLPQRVESSRRRSRRCLLMTSVLAKTAVEQGEIHELLALVYYDGLQNVVPFYDQRSSTPSKDAAWKIFCQNSMSHFKKAFKLKEDWSHAFYVGKLCEKLEYSQDVSLSYYAQAIALNPSAVDPFYRMHASRLKLLCKCGKQNEVALKVIAKHSFAQSAKETATNILNGIGCESSESTMHVEDVISNNNSELVDYNKLEKVWYLLYSDCLSALETCVEGDLKHFHKARYMLAQGLYRRGGIGDLEKAKEELSFCFKSSRSPFTINMWEIDSVVKKGRRKPPGPSGNRRALEVNLAESSRKFITCIRKYILFYLKLLEETGDIFTLERAYLSLRTDKRFSLCLEDLVPLTLGRYVKALITSILQAGSESDASTNSVEHLLERLFNLFLEQVNLWSDICSLPELKSPEFTENSLYGYLYQYIQLLEINVKVETLEGINEKIRKRLKNPKLSNSHCAKVYRHVSAAWCRSFVISMALITPLHSRLSTDMNLLGDGLENAQLLSVDLQSEELWSSAFEDPDHLKILETKWNPSLSKIKNVIVKKVSDEDLETAATILRSSYNFYKDTSCALLPSGINLYMVPVQLATETYMQPGIDGVDILDMNTSRKLLLWAYSLLHGHCTSVSQVIKYCEENAKSRIRKGPGGSSTPLNAIVHTVTPPQAGGGNEGFGKISEQEAESSAPISGPLLETDKPATSTSPETKKTQKEPSTMLEDVRTPNLAVHSLPERDGENNEASGPQHGPGNTFRLPDASLPDWVESNGASSNEK